MKVPRELECGTAARMHYWREIKACQRDPTCGERKVPTTITP